MDGDRAENEPVISEQWVAGGWLIQFIRLGGGQAVRLNQTTGRHYVKVVIGELVNVDRKPFAESFAVRDTAVSADNLLAGTQGAIFSVFTQTTQVAESMSDMSSVRIKGPNENAFTWQRFDEKFDGFMNYFDEVEAYMSPGFHLLNENGVEVTYVNLWTCGKGVDLSTHNHANDPSPASPAFAETHWVFNIGAEGAGMYLCDAPGGPKQRFPMRRGQEHGPFFAIDPGTGRPVLRANGAVEYPWHGWQGGQDGSEERAYDFVAAFETNPEVMLVA